MKSSITNKIVKSIGVFGGVQVISIICAIVRTKIISVVIGPVGIGLMGLFLSATEMIGSLTTLGFRNSSVRDVASESNPLRRRTLITVVRRWAWILGVFGAAVIAALSPIISLYTFGNYSHWWCYAILSAVVLISSLMKGEEVVLQGTARLGNLASGTVIGSVVGVALCIPLYFLYGEASIAPSLIVYWAVAGSFMWHFGRKATAASPKQPVSASDTYRLGKSFIKLGVFLTLSDSVAQLASYLFITYLNASAGTEQVGLYQAGFNIINKYAGLLFTAMSMEYFPRLASVSQSRIRTQLFLTKQINITLAVIFPFVTLIIILCPLIVRILYSSEFIDIVPYVTIGVLGTSLRAISWCMAFVIIAKGRGSIYLVTESISAVSGLLLNIVFYQTMGITGLGVAYILWYLLYWFIMIVVGRRYYGINNHRSSLAILAVVILMPTIVAAATLAGATTMGILLAVVSLAISVAMGRRVLAK